MQKKTSLKEYCVLSEEKIKKLFYSEAIVKSKRAGIAADPLLTNPLNSDTKLQIGTT